MRNVCGSIFIVALPLTRTFLMKAYSIFDIQMCTFERNRVLFIDLSIYFLTF